MARLKTTLVEKMLHAATTKKGLIRLQIQEWAAANGFNPGSVSPTLAKLVNAGKLKRISRGIYAAA
jgi:predicted transcriptional regulator of viral defense system